MTLEQQQRVTAGVLTLILMTLAILFLKDCGLSIRKYSAEKLSEIIEFKIQKPMEKKEEKEEAEETKDEEIKETLIVDNTIAEIDEIITEDMAEELKNNDLAPLLDHEILEQPETMIDDGGDLYDPGLPPIDLGGDLNLNLGDLGDLGAGSDVSGGIGITRGGKFNTGGSGSARIPKARRGESALTGKKHDEGEGAISKIKNTKMSIDDWDPNKFIPKIEKWIKQNGRPIPAKVRLLLEFEQGDIPSLDFFEYDGKKYRIYLIYRTGQKEIRICLIEGEQFVQLIDSGISSGGTNYLKIGTIRWKKDSSGKPIDEIDSFSGRRLSPSDPKAAGFYNVFMSWLEFNKIK